MAIVKDPRTGRYISTNDAAARGALPSRTRTTTSRSSRGSFASQPESQPVTPPPPVRTPDQEDDGILKTLAKGVVGGITQPVQMTGELGSTIGRFLSDSRFGRATQPIFNSIVRRTGTTREDVEALRRGIQGTGAPSRIDKFNPLYYGETFGGERTSVTRPFQDQGLKPFLGKTVETAFNIATGIVAPGAGKAGIESIKVGGREGLKQVAKQGAKTGAKLGLVAGLGTGLQRDADLKGTLGYTAAGGVGGAGIGAAIPVAANLGVRALGRAGSVLGPRITGRLQNILNREGTEEAAQQATRFISGEAGETAAEQAARTEAGLLRAIQGDTTEELGAILPQRARNDLLSEATQQAEEVIPTQIAQQLERIRYQTIELPQSVTNDLVELGVRNEVLQQISTGNPSILNRLSEREVTNALDTLQRVAPDIATNARNTIANNIVRRNTIRQELEQEFGKSSGLGKFVGEARNKLVDFTTPIESTLTRAERAGQFNIRPQDDVRLQFDRIFRAPTLANQFLRDNGFVQAVQEAERRGVTNQLSEYLIARQAEDIRAARPEVTLGRSAAQDRAIIQAFESQLGDLASRVNDFSRQLLDQSVDSGLVAKEAADNLKQVFPNYVPVNRVFSVIEQGGSNFTRGKGGGSLASLAQQSVVQELKGSRRAIQNPLQSLVERTHDVVLQSERNKAAQQMASYRNLPGNPFGIKELVGDAKPGPGKGKFSTLVDGIKRTFEIDEEFASVIAAASPQQIGLIGRMLAFPVRVAKAGITGFNFAFSVGNMVKDQFTGALNSPNARKALQEIPRAMFSALKHDDLYDEVVRSGALTTSYDLLRNQSVDTLSSIRATSSTASRIKYAVKSPKDFIKTIERLGRGVENVISRSEELRRIQEFSAVRKDLLSKGASQETADLIGADAARWVTANFFRRGEWGQALNSAFLYLNAGIQGNRSTLRALRDRPAQTGVKFISTIAVPLAAITAWNLKDPQRKAAYDDILDFEKEGNLVLIPENPTKDENGLWNVIKIPLPPNIASLTIPIRKALEGAEGMDPVRFRDIAQGLIGGVSPITPDFDNRRAFSSSVLSQVTPQAIRPSIEAFANRRFFTDTPIEPSYIGGVPTQNLPPELRVKDNTSGTARAIGGVLNTSPIQTEQFIKSTFGGVGSQTLNLLDRTAANLGLIPEDQIGGEGVIANLRRRVSQAYGGDTQSKQFDIANQLKTEAGTEKYLLTRSAIEYVNQLEQESGGLPRRAPADLRRSDPALYEAINDEIKDRQRGFNETDSLLKGLGVTNGTRAQFILELEKGMSPDEIAAFERDLRSKKILSSAVRKQLRDLKR